MIRPLLLLAVEEFQEGLRNRWVISAVLLLAILAFSRCGAAYSIDRLIGKRLGASGRLKRETEPSSEYTWPLRLAWMMWSLEFFAAGVAKLRLGGWEWIVGDQMSLILLTQYYTAIDLPTWGAALTNYPVLCKLGAFVGAEATQRPRGDPAARSRAAMRLAGERAWRGIVLRGTATRAVDAL